ncbi:hypothetical protein DP117_08695 [Brasilonema sp. UFV-L1]|nr:hypothetical protein [Brasilonema sp. UFV-L1]
MELKGSITLQVLVLALVIVCVRTVATSTVTETRFSLWLLPLWTVNAIWSYYRRHSSNVSVQFCISIEILAALGSLGAIFGD